MPIKKEPQPKALPTDSPLESEPLAKVFAEQENKKPSRELAKKAVSLAATLLLICLLALIIFQLVRTISAPKPPPTTPEPTPEDGSTVIIGPVTQYATHSATRNIEKMIEESEEAFKNIRFREDAYLPPQIDLEVKL